MIRRLAVLVLLGLTALACGQKEGVHVASGGGQGAAEGLAPGTGGDLGAGDASTGGPAAGGDAGATAGADAGTPADGGTDAAGGDGEAGGQAGAPAGADAAPGQGAAATPTGPVWGKEIVIGIHAPLTGAAPLPATFAAAIRLYPDYINKKGGIHGRTLKAELIDDEYQPATAVQKCTVLVQQRKAFVLVGAGGTDQIQACARYGATAAVPYLSNGVTEVGLRGLKNYFALSMSYPQQGPYLANYIKKEIRAGANAVAMVYSNTRNFSDARDSFVKAMGSIKKEYKLARTPSQAELSNTARTICSDGIKVAYPLMAPLDWLVIAGQVKSNCGDQVKWAGVGLTNGLNTVARNGCRANNSIQGAVFFSPFPGVDKAAQLDPQFAEAVRGKSWDDIGVLAWAAIKSIGGLIDKAGKDLSRPGFVQAAERTQNLVTGMGPALSFSPTDHFGARQVHVLRANCSKGQFETLATFASY